MNGPLGFPSKDRARLLTSAANGVFDAACRGVLALCDPSPKGKLRLIIVSPLLTRPRVAKANAYVPLWILLGKRV